eukprot:COSAG01_NODE_3403_length_6133_cov_63.939178_5_plen_103_part_00
MYSPPRQRPAESVRAEGRGPTAEYDKMDSADAEPEPEPAADATPSVHRPHGGATCVTSCEEAAPPHEPRAHMTKCIEPGRDRNLCEVVLLTRYLVPCVSGHV